jgi:hypothetical protein
MHRTGSAAPPPAEPDALLLQTIAKLKRAAHHWLADATANNGWPASEEAIMDLGYTSGSKYEQCRFKRRALKKLASGEEFNILISGGSVTQGSNLCGCLPNDKTKCTSTQQTAKCNPEVSGYGYRSRPWPWLLGGLLEANHDHIENGQKEEREEALKSKAEWLLEGLPFTVDVDVVGGYAMTGMAHYLDSGTLPHLKSGVFRSESNGSRVTSGWMDRYDLIIMDHSVNDLQVRCSVFGTEYCVRGDALRPERCPSFSPVYSVSLSFCPLCIRSVSMLPGKPLHRTGLSHFTEVLQLTLTLSTFTPEYLSRISFRMTKPTHTIVQLGEGTSTSMESA